MEKSRSLNITSEVDLMTERRRNREWKAFSEVYILWRWRMTGVGRCVEGGEGALRRKWKKAGRGEGLCWSAVDAKVRAGDRCGRGREARV